MKENDRRVMVVGTGSALGEGIRNLLAREPQLEVATAIYDEPATFLKEAEQIYPDVIVLSEAGLLDEMRTCELLCGIAPRRALRLIVIRPDENILEVYDKQYLKVTHNNDLIALITNRRVPPA